MKKQENQENKQKKDQKQDKKQRKLSMFFKAGGILIAAGLIFTFIGVAKSQSDRDKYDKYQTLSSEDEVRKALEGENQKYFVINAPLTGEVCEDPKGILRDEYICLDYDSYYFTYRSRNDDSMVYDTSWDWGDTVSNNSSTFTVYGDIPVEMNEYKASKPIITLSQGKVKPEYIDSISAENGIDYYYPGEIANFENNIRYRVSGICQNAMVAFVAEIGEGHLKLSSINDSEIPPISGLNDIRDLEFLQDETSGTLGLVAMVLIGIGFISLILGVIDTISSRLEEKK